MEKGLTYLDKKLQSHILSTMAEKYPYPVNLVELFRDLKISPEEEKANLQYLLGHKLVESSGIRDGAGHDISFRLSSHGIDFLRGDGLADILCIGTVRLHTDSIKALILGIVEDSGAPEEQRNVVKKVLSTASDETIRQGLGYLFRRAAGFIPQHLGDAYVWVDEFLKIFQK